MRILHVIPGLTRERGGPTTVVEALARHQSAAGHAVVVLTTSQGLRRGEHFVELAPGVEVERVETRGPDRLAYAPGWTDAVRRRLRGCDVVHAHSLFTYPIHRTLAEAPAAGVPLVLRPCGLLHPYSLRRSRWVKRLYLALWGRRVRRACAAWHYTSEQEARASWPHDDSAHFVLPNGVEPDEFAVAPDAARTTVQRRWPELGDAPYVLFLGRLHAKKRLDLLLEAFLAAAPPEYRLVVAGPEEGGVWEPLRRRLLRDGAAARRVLRVGAVHGDEKAALLAAAELFALPSEHENFGIAALEALTARTPVLLSPHVDLAEPAERAGLVRTAPLNLAAWKERLAELLRTPPRREPRDWDWVAANYSWRALAARLDDEYRRLLREPLHAAAPTHG